MAKHGWHSFMIEKRGAAASMAATSDPPFNIMGAASSQFSNRGANENKRATIFFNLRENSAGGLE